LGKTPDFCAMQLYTLILLFALAQPAVTQTAADQPAADQLAADQPAADQLALAQPSVDRPCHHTSSSSPAFLSWPTQCRVTGTANLKATGMGIPYNNSFKLASVDVSYQGHSSTVKGMLVNDSLIQLNLGQDIPQNFQGDGFSASLKGTIKNGFLSRINNKIRMFIHVDADGTILWQGLTIPVTGKVETDTHN
jgi:hypothetical protein